MAIGYSTWHSGALGTPYPFVPNTTLLVTSVADDTRYYWTNRLASVDDAIQFAQSRGWFLRGGPGPHEYIAEAAQQAGFEYICSPAR